MVVRWHPFSILEQWDTGILAIRYICIYCNILKVVGHSVIGSSMYPLYGIYLNVTDVWVRYEWLASEKYRVIRVQGRSLSYGGNS